jgi:hypothetical protein
MMGLLELDELRRALDLWSFRLTFGCKQCKHPTSLSNKVKVITSYRIILDRSRVARSHIIIQNHMVEQQRSCEKYIRHVKK